MKVKIPDMQEPDSWSAIDICNSSFVELIDGEMFDVKMQYPLMKMKNAVQQCFVRQEVYERLIVAQELLPQGIKLRILDAWRPYKLQEELYIKYSRKIIKEFNLETKSEIEQKKIIKRYVTKPKNNRIEAPVHTTGGAVDVTLVDLQGKLLDMGTAFDVFSEKAHTCYFEDKGDVEVRDNRRLLYHIMSKAGFTNLPSEWWHYDYGNVFWAYYNRKPVIYTGVFTIEEVC